MNRILVIRGGAIGDFILTLPAIRTLRESYPQSHLEVMCYPRVAPLVVNRFYAEATQSLDSGGLARFFAKSADLPNDLVAYFASFDLVLSYLYDPDRIFETNLKRAGVKQYLTGPGKLHGHRHAAEQLAAPLAKLGLKPSSLAPRIFLSDEDRKFKQGSAGNLPGQQVALHPGSGSDRKNWPLPNWIALGHELMNEGCSLSIVGGESDEMTMNELESAWSHRPVRFVRNRPLIQVAALLENSVFVGHDSGISHLAAAVQARCVLLFGPTDPKIWAPLNEKNVRVVSAPTHDLSQLDVSVVGEAVRQILSAPVGMNQTSS